ncbi:MAG: hypothetical protein J6Q51_04745 [Clostridia bacterium]|nr:hypothetical protein [Clostridia bacterium]
MKKRVKLFASIATMIACIATFIFGVYAASTFSYSMQGNITYSMTNVFVDVDAKLYRSTLNVLSTENEITQNMAKFTAGNTPTATELVSSYTTPTISTFNFETDDFEVTDDNVLKAKTNTLPISYGPYNASYGTAYAYYVVITIRNYGGTMINASVTKKSKNESLLNSYLPLPADIQISASQDINAPKVGRIVLAFGLKDELQDVSGMFEYLVSIESQGK